MLEMAVHAGVLASSFFLQLKTSLCWTNWWKSFGIGLNNASNASRQFGSCDSRCGLLLESLEFLKDCGLLSWKKLSHRMNVFSVLYRVGRVFCGGCWLLGFFFPTKIWPSWQNALRFWGFYRISNYGSCWPQLLEKHRKIRNWWNVICCCFSILY